MKPFKYQIGEVVETKTGKITILDQIRKPTANYRQKFYLAKCCIDGYEFEIREPSVVKGGGCAICGGSRVVSGYNDIATLYPEKIKYFYNPEDAKAVSLKSNKKRDFKCSVCGSIIRNKYVGIMTDTPPLCPNCKDRTPYPEKIMWTVLSQIEPEFIYRLNFNWSNDREYDFYIPNKSLIIEMNGAQHYSKAFDGFKTGKNKTVQVQKGIDNYKRELALNNGIKNYIQIDCNKSDFNYIKENILKSELSNLYDLSDFDWDKCNIDSLKPIIKICCDYWNQGYRSTFQIKEKTHLSANAIRDYLKRGAIAGICDYDPQVAKERSINILKSGEKAPRKKVICLTTQQIFVSGKAAVDWCGTRTIYKCLKHEREHAGKHPQTKELLSWMYLDEYFEKHPEITDKELYITEHLFKLEEAGNVSS